MLNHFGIGNIKHPKELAPMYKTALFPSFYYLFNIQLLVFFYVNLETTFIRIT
jgi:hypothetical protein